MINDHIFLIDWIYIDLRFLCYDIGQTMDLKVSICVLIKRVSSFGKDYNRWLNINVRYSLFILKTIHLIENIFYTI